MTLVTAVDAPASVLGEGPVWSPEEKVLYWIDVVGKAIFRYDPASGRTDTRSLPFAPSAILPCEDGSLLLVTKKGMAHLKSFEAEPVSLPDAGVNFKEEIFNDAACDARGRLWVGTRDFHVTDPKGHLFRLEGKLDLTRHADGLTISNGIAWSPDGRTMYHVESEPGRVYAYDFDIETGSIGQRRILVDYAGDGNPGGPDGCTVDAEGCLWVAEVDVWRVARYAPDGRFLREIRLPVERPTSVMFGGDGLATLFVTSMQFGLSADALAEQPEAGKLFAVDAGVAGLREHRFSGIVPPAAGPTDI